jgi:hypothetical protein
MKRMLVAVAFLTVALALVTAVHAQDTKELAKKLNAAIQSEDWSTVCSVTKDIGQLDSEKAVKVIFQIALQIERKDVYEAAKDALLGITDKDAISFICQQARKHKKWEIRMLAVEVVKDKEGDDVFQTLLDCLKDKNDNVIREAVAALKSKGDDRAVDPLIELLGRIEEGKGLIWVDVRTALTALTGYDYDSAEKWEEFWRVRKEELKANPGSPETAKPVNADDVRTGLIEKEKRKAPKFFGQEVMSKKIMFVIDRSGSMQARDPVLKKDEGGGLRPADPNHKPGPEDPWGGDTSLPLERARIERVKKELCKCIAGMDPKTKFNVIYFSSSMAIWQNKLVYANTKNKNSAIKWVSGLGPMGATHTDDALKKAFEDEEFDTLFLLSDGQPFRNGQMVPVNPILEWVRNANRQRKVKIFTFGFANVKSTQSVNKEEMLKLLQGLARDHNGKFTDIYW